MACKVEVPPEFISHNSLGRRISLLNDDVAVNEAAAATAAAQQKQSQPSQPPLHQPYNFLPSPSASSVSSLSTDSRPVLYSSNYPFNGGSTTLPPPHVLMAPYGASATTTHRRVPLAIQPKGNAVAETGFVPSTHGKKYECVTCGRLFTTSGHVSRHNRIHTGVKPFACPEADCTARFSRQDNCMQHYRTHCKVHKPADRKTARRWPAGQESETVDDETVRRVNALIALHVPTSASSQDCMSPSSSSSASSPPSSASSVSSADALPSPTKRKYSKRAKSATTTQKLLPRLIMPNNDPLAHFAAVVSALDS